MQDAPLFDAQFWVKRCVFFSIVCDTLQSSTEPAVPVDTRRNHKNQKDADSEDLKTQAPEGLGTIQWIEGGRFPPL